jgi:hypothetical protein
MFSLINQAFTELSAAQQQKIAATWTPEQGMSQEFIQAIKPKITQQLHAEFDEFSEIVPNYSDIMHECLDNMQSCQPTIAVKAVAAQNISSPTAFGAPILVDYQRLAAPANTENEPADLLNMLMPRP